MLPHFTKVLPAVELQEPVYNNLFEITFAFPKILNLSTKDQDIMMMSANKISLDITKPLGVVKQKFKYSERLYVNTPTSTAIESLTVDFTINVDDKFSMRTWNYMEKWRRLGHNSQTGALHYKRDMVGGLTLHVGDREGTVIRRVEYKNVMCLGLNAQEFQWETGNILSGTATFCSDYWIDQYYDITATA